MGLLQTVAIVIVAAASATDSPPPAASDVKYDESPTSEPPDRRVIEIEPRTPESVAHDHGSSVVTRAQMEERLPRSAPDALRYEPGVYVQQTAHSQASPYVRGVTGQRTALFFDGIRLNTSTLRQGPNQYYFTVDARTIQRIDVVRGSSSTRYGSDAIGGAILTTPVQAPLDGSRKWNVHPRMMVRAGTADRELGGRAQLGVGYRDKVAVFGGVGYRDVGFLKSGGRITEPATGEAQNIPPRFASDGKTQLGTGYRELTADTRVTWRVDDKHRLTAAYYDYRQSDAPRTDKCPEPEEQLDGCLTYLNQDRTLTYLAWDLDRGPAAARHVRWSASYQRQHERRVDTEGAISATERNGRDDVHTVGSRLQIATKSIKPKDWLALEVAYGVDGYFDTIDSAAWTRFTDNGVVAPVSRGQYLDGAQYLTSGLWTELRTTWWKKFGVRAGGRGALSHARADGDETSSSPSVKRSWVSAVGNAGVSYRPWKFLTLLGNVDQGFRAPNLDDLTSRQKTGPGFQKENASLDPERSLGFELGTRVRHPWFEIDAFGFRSTIKDLIARRTLDQCPPNDAECAAARTRFELGNADGTAVFWGVDGGARLFLPADLGLRTTIAYAWAEMPNASAGPSRVPVSRVPPLNGTLEAGWRSSRWGVYLIGVMRWAALQDRLAPADEVDERIPAGGTPGYVVFDIRTGVRFGEHALLGLTFENVGDAAYRFHGSSINGAGRSLLLHAEIGY